MSILVIKEQATEANSSEATSANNVSLVIDLTSNGLVKAIDVAVGDLAVRDAIQFRSGETYVPSVAGEPLDKGTDTKLDALLAKYPSRRNKDSSQHAERDVAADGIQGGLTVTHVTGTYDQLVARLYRLLIRAADKSSHELLLERLMQGLEEGMYFTSSDDGVITEAAMAGAITIIGMSAAGKSTLVNELANLDKAELIISGEPDRRSVTLFLSIVRILCCCVSSSKQTVILDSLRDLVYSGIGATLSGGVASALVRVVAALSRVAVRSNTLLFLVVNPLTSRYDNFVLLREAMAGSSFGIITLLKGLAPNGEAPIGAFKAEISIRGVNDRQTVVVDNSAVPSFMRSLLDAGSTSITSADVGRGNISPDVAGLYVNTASISHSGNQERQALFQRDAVTLDSFNWASLI